MQERESNRKTGLVWHEMFMWHQNDPTAAGVVTAGGYVQPGEHTENPETKRRFKNLLDVTGLTQKLVPIAPREATDEEILRVHTADYLAHLKAIDPAGGWAGPMAQIGPGGLGIARLAAGGVMEAVDAVLDGAVDSVYALVRPCGHHATPETGMGFCVINNGAIAARHALHRGVKRVAFVDWDVHHGNGTQAAFWDEPSVLTISIHQHGCFPQDEGFVEEIGGGAGEGFNLNVPLPPGSGSGAYEEAMESVVFPALRAYRPELIIVPCGFDAGGFDTLGRMMLYSDVFRWMTRRLLEVAEEIGGCKTVFCHEGGYHGPMVAFMGLAVVEEISGIRTPVDDPFIPFIKGLSGQDLQPHQEAMIETARATVARYKDQWAAAG